MSRFLGPSFQLLAQKLAASPFHFPSCVPVPFPPDEKARQVQQWTPVTDGIPLETAGDSFNVWLSDEGFSPVT